MKISPEQLAQLRARRQANPTHRGMALLTPRHQWLQTTLLVLGVLCIAAFFGDMYRISRNTGGIGMPQLLPVAEEIQRLERNLATGQRIKASSGLFSCILPEGWSIRTGEAAAPYDLTFVSPNRVSISLSAARVAYNDLPALFAALREREREFNVRTETQSFYLHGLPAARREVALMKTKALVVDLVTNHVAHQIFCEVPIEVFDQYRPTLLKYIETYQPTSPAGSAGKAP